MLERLCVRVCREGEGVGGVKEWISALSLALWRQKPKETSAVCKVMRSYPVCGAWKNQRRCGVWLDTRRRETFSIGKLSTSFLGGFSPRQQQEKQDNLLVRAGCFSRLQVKWLSKTIQHLVISQMNFYVTGRWQFTVVAKTFRSPYQEHFWFCRPSNTSWVDHQQCNFV